MKFALPSSQARVNFPNSKPFRRNMAQRYELRQSTAAKLAVVVAVRAAAAVIAAAAAP
jgi:hypothetical protein